MMDMFRLHRLLVINGHPTTLILSNEDFLAVSDLFHRDRIYIEADVTKPLSIIRRSCIDYLATKITHPWTSGNEVDLSSGKI